MIIPFPLLVNTFMMSSVFNSTDFFNNKTEPLNLSRKTRDTDITWTWRPREWLILNETDKINIECAQVDPQDMTSTEEFYCENENKEILSLRDEVASLKVYSEIEEKLKENLQNKIKQVEEKYTKLLVEFTMLKQKNSVDASQILEETTKENNNMKIQISGLEFKYLDVESKNKICDSKVSDLEVNFNIEKYKNSELTGQVQNLQTKTTTLEVDIGSCRQENNEKDRIINEVRAAHNQKQVELNDCLSSNNCKDQLKDLEKRAKRIFG